MNKIDELAYTNFMLDMKEYLPVKAEEFDRLLNVIKLINDGFNGAVEFVYLNKYESIVKPFRDIEDLKVKFIVAENCESSIVNSICEDLSYYFGKDLKKYSISFLVLRGNIGITNEFLIWQRDFSNTKVYATTELKGIFDKVKEKYKNALVFADLKHTMLIKAKADECSKIYNDLNSIGLEYALTSTNMLALKFLLLPIEDRWLKFDLPLFEVDEVEYVDASEDTGE